MGEPSCSSSSLSSERGLKVLLLASLLVPMLYLLAFGAFFSFLKDAVIDSPNLILCSSVIEPGFPNPRVF